jgi:hypothetical protein
MRTIKRFSIFVGVFLFVFLVCVTVLITSVFKSRPSTSQQVAVEQADTDGFEVVVIENDAGKILDARSMKLIEAKQAVQQKNSTTFVIPFESQQEIEKKLVETEHFEGILLK